MRPADLARIRVALTRSTHFGPLAPAVLDRMAHMADVRHARNAERIERAGTADDRLWIVVDGAVRLSARPKESGREYVHAVLGPGSFFGLASAVGHGPFTIEARAFGETCVAVIDGTRLRDALELHPRFWRYVSGMLSKRLRLALGVIEDNRVRPLPERVARRLLGHAMSSELAEGAQPVLRMTQADLARMVDVARSRLNPVLKKMEADGLLKAGYRGITLLDLGRLRALAGPGVLAF
jgi:CRP/FNR family transcriptional regulator, cyclic AMP receptor protein